MKLVELPPLVDSDRDYEQLEWRLKKYFLEKIYIPLLKSINLPQTTLKNAKPTALEDALFTGKVTYSGGAFSGNFNAAISKELRALGAKFHSKTSTYRISETELPVHIRGLVASSYTRFQEQMAKLDQKLAEIIPEELASQFKCEDLFDKQLFKADQSFKKNVKKIAVAPDLTPEIRARIAREWQDNIKLKIRGWTEEQITDMRKKLYESVTQGARRESLIPPLLEVTRTIQGSHEEALKKAKFLAHQESRLLMATFKQARYEDAGSKSYIWRCVHRPHDTDPKHHTLGNVRYSHGLLDGTEQQWSFPPITTNPGEPVRRCHPGQDYGCRCFPRVLFRVSDKK